ncbi:MAG: DUF1080 domain-containing protein [Planctomycetes bacterium]|nr:DUF1080 domain-containing protein [Planctomycetota bacterium]
MNPSDPNLSPTRTVAPASSPSVPPSNPETLGDATVAGGTAPFHVGEYVLLGELGRGGMGVVYRAEDPRLKREVALKVMLPQFAANSTAKARFVREARAQAKVEHDHVAAIHQVHEHDGLPYIVMPLLKGMTLQTAIKANPRPPLTEVIRIGREVAEGLAAAHEKGLVHRDIKPANIWLEGKKLRVKVLDFGLARIAADADATEGSDGPVTNEGAVVGTPAYMSPEQGRGLPVDGRTDLFSLGVMLYQMTTGELPFRGTTTLAILTSLALDNPPPPIAKNPAVPQSLSDFVMRLLSKDPAYRPPTSEIAAEELRAIETGLVNAVRVIPLDSPPPLILAQVGPDPFADLDATEANSEPEAETAEERDGPESPIKPRGGFPTWALVGVVLLAVAGVVGVVASQMGKKPPVDVVQADPPKEKPPVVTPPIVVSPPAEPTFFNGKDLTGWVGRTDAWRIDNGDLLGTPPEGADSTFITTSQSYRDFELSFQVRVGNDRPLGSGLLFRADEPTPDGKIRGKLADIQLGGKTGSLWRESGFVKEADPAAEKAARPGDFDDVTVRCVGRHVTVKVNGVKALDGEFDLPLEGRIGWHLKPGVPVRLRNIRFTDLSKPLDSTFFNGKDLTGWEGDLRLWTVANGEIVSLKVENLGPTHLRTQKAYRDFELSFDLLRKSPNPLSYPVVRFRASANELFGSPTLQFYANRIVFPAPGVKPLAVNPDVFNSVTIRAEGRRLKITVNGSTLADGEYDFPSEGVIAWGLAPGEAEITVRNIRFTDLSKPPLNPTFFNGTDLTGLEGDRKVWRVEGGEIVGAFPVGTPRVQTFLYSPRPYGDFEIACQIRLKGGLGNSGVQFRSSVANQSQFHLAGPQADFGAKCWGALYSESTGKGVLSKPDPDIVAPIVKRDDFNDVVVRCVGKHVTIWLNGTITVKGDFEIPPTGVVGWQLHDNGTEEVRIRKVRFTDLSGPSVADLLTSPDWEWSGKPENLGDGVNGPGDEYDPTLTADGLRLIYQSARGGERFLYEARRKSVDQLFGDARRLDELGDGGANFIVHPFVSADGLSLLFVSNRPGGAGGKDIWETRRPDREAKWGRPVHLGSVVNSDLDEETPGLSADGLTLYFSLRPNAAKGYEIWVARRAAIDAAWGKPELLGPEVNTDSDETFPRPLPDGRGFAFLRRKDKELSQMWLAMPKAGGGWDVRMTHAASGNAPSYTTDGRSVYFDSKSLPGGRGGQDLWQMRRVPKAKPADRERKAAELLHPHCDLALHTLEGKVLSYALKPEESLPWNRSASILSSYVREQNGTRSGICFGRPLPICPTCWR